MIEFKEIQIQDKAWIDECLARANRDTSNFNFSTMFLWNDYYPLKAALWNGFLLARHREENGVVYSMPVGGEDIAAAVEMLRADAHENGCALTVLGATGYDAERVKRLYGDGVDISYKDSMSDYIYSAERLATLSGRKLHAKRNHINRLEQTCDWSFTEIGEDNFAVCAELARQWYDDAADRDDESMEYERLALMKAFDNFEALGLMGGLLTVDSRAAAFTLGERLNSDTFLVHFEKAFADVYGAYPIVNREFVRSVLKKYPDIKYINREEDLGLEGLRQAKMSYCPDKMGHKFILKFKDHD